MDRALISELLTLLYDYRRLVRSQSLADPFPGEVELSERLNEVEARCLSQADH